MLTAPIRLNLAPFLTQGGNDTVAHARLKKRISIFLVVKPILAAVGLKGDTIRIDRLRGNVVLGIHVFSFVVLPCYSSRQYV